MNIATYHVVGRTKANSLAVASEHDFLLKPASLAADLQYVASNPSVSPYCIDARSGKVLLTETPEGLDIASSTFVYDAQYRHATRIHTIEINDLLSIAHSAAPPPPILFLHSTGRCGSTLLARALTGRGVTTFSEPDILTQMALLGRLHDQDGVNAIVALYGGLIRFFTRGRMGAVAFKLRGVSSEHADYMAMAFPNAKSLFLYRDAAAVAASYARITGRSLGDWELSQEERRAWSVLVPSIRDRNGRLTGFDLVASLWAGPVRCYLRSQSLGMWLGALDYVKLLADTSAVLDALLYQLRMDKPRAKPQGERLKIHSQTGSHLDPDHLRLTENLVRELASPEFNIRIASSLRAIDPSLSLGMTLPRAFFPQEIPKPGVRRV